MVYSFEETKELEEIKQANKKELAEINMTNAREEHTMKMSRLATLLSIAQAGGVFRDEDKD